MVTSNKDSIPCNTFRFQCIYNILKKYKLSKKKLKVNIVLYKSLKNCRKNRKSDESPL